MGRPRKSAGPEPGYHVLDDGWDDCEGWTAWVMERLLRSQGAPTSMRTCEFLPSEGIAGAAGELWEAADWQAAHKAEIEAKRRAAEALRAWEAERAAREAEWEARREEREAAAAAEKAAADARLKAYWEKRKEEEAARKARWQERERQAEEELEALQAKRAAAAAQTSIVGFPLLLPPVVTEVEAKAQLRRRDAERARILAAPWQCKKCLKQATIDPYLGGFKLTCEPCGESTFAAHDLLVRVVEAGRLSETAA